MSHMWEKFQLCDSFCNDFSGMLSNSYVAEVYYKLNPDEEELNVESWFIKVKVVFCLKESAVFKVLRQTLLGFEMNLFY